MGTYSSVTLDIIGVAALGVQFQNLDAPTPFHECYHRVFDPPLLGQVLMTINAFIPVRRIPLRENREFLEANAEVHRLVREIVRERLEEIAARGDAHSSHDGGRRDLLTYIIEETYGTENAWTEDQLLDHVRKTCTATTMPLTRGGAKQAPD